MICQRSTGAGLSQLRRPERRRLDAAHPARHRHGAFAMGDAERRFGDIVVADAGAMHEGFVGQVHQIIDHQPVVASRVNGLAIAGPFGIVVPVHVRYQRRIGQRRIAHPEPDETMSLHHRIGSHAGRWIDGLLRRHVGAAALRIVFQPVIAADQRVAVEPSFRQRHQSVPAGIFQCADLSIGLAEQHDMLAADGPGKQRVLEVDIPCRGVPGVQWKRCRHGSLPRMCSNCIHYGEKLE